MERDQRVHFLDNLRAFMMLLGLVLHSAVSFVNLPSNANWPWRSESTSELLYILLVWVHSFRMEVFFIASGYFLWLLIDKKGIQQTFVHRVKRILLPLVIFWVLVFVPTVSGFLYGIHDGSWSHILTYLSSPMTPSNPILQNAPSYQVAMFGQFNFLHLWFLYFLVLFCFAGLLLSRLPLSHKAFAWIKTPYLPLMVGLATAASLILDKNIVVHTSTTLIPYLNSLLVYGLFFFSGALLYTRKSSFKVFADKELLLGIVSVIVFSGFLYSIKLLKSGGGHGLSPKEIFLVSALLSGLTIGFTSFFFVGFFAKRLDVMSPKWRYLLDASYSMYLFQLPFTIWIPVLMEGSSLSAMMKFSITLSVTTVSTLFIYNYLVRPSWMGQLLNGKRMSPVRFLFPKKKVLRPSEMSI